jgi:hypothetical protein
VATIVIIGMVLVGMWVVAGWFSRRVRFHEEPNVDADRAEAAATRAAAVVAPTTLLQGGPVEYGGWSGDAGGDAGGADGGGY